MKIVCITPIKHLDGVYERLEQYGEVIYVPEISKLELTTLLSETPDIEYLFDTLPFFEVFMLAIRGDGNCAEVLWSFLGISIPGWTLVGFFILFSYSLFSLFISNKLHSKN